MSRNLTRVSARGVILWSMFWLNIAVLVAAVLASYAWLWALSITLSLTILAVQNAIQKKHSILSNFPLLGYIRFGLEAIRPEMRQYFWESDLDGKPLAGGNGPLCTNVQKMSGKQFHLAHKMM